MTCIVACRFEDHTTIVADDRVDYNGQILRENNKIWHPSWSYAIAEAGDGDFIHAIHCGVDYTSLADWAYPSEVLTEFVQSVVAARKEYPESDAEFLVCVADKIWVVHGSGASVEVTGRYMAIGSGHAYAMGYLDSEMQWTKGNLNMLSIEGAIEAAHDRCVYVGHVGQIVTVKHGG